MTRNLRFKIVASFIVFRDLSGHGLRFLCQICGSLFIISIEACYFCWRLFGFAWILKFNYLGMNALVALTCVCLNVREYWILLYRCFYLYDLVYLLNILSLLRQCLCWGYFCCCCCYCYCYCYYYWYHC